MKIKPITILLFFLLSLPIQVLAQKNDAAATIEQLEKEMYRLYPTRNIDEFMDVTERLKEATLKAGNEGLFYRAWANQAYYIFKIDRQVVETMQAEVERHRDGAEPNDDMTIMCLKALNIKH